MWTYWKLIIKVTDFTAKSKYVKFKTCSFSLFILRSWRWLHARYEFHNGINHVSLQWRNSLLDFRATTLNSRRCPYNLWATKHAWFVISCFNYWTYTWIKTSWAKWISDKQLEPVHTSDLSSRLDNHLVYINNANRKKFGFSDIVYR